MLSFILLSAYSWDLESVELTPKLCKLRAGYREGLAFSQNGIALSPCHKGWRNRIEGLFFKRGKRENFGVDWTASYWQNFQVFAVWRTFIEQRKRHQHQEDSESLTIRGGLCRWKQRYSYKSYKRYPKSMYAWDSHFWRNGPISSRKGSCVVHLVLHPLQLATPRLHR